MRWCPRLPLPHRSGAASRARFEMKKDKKHQNRAREVCWRFDAQGAAIRVAPNEIKATTVFLPEKHAVSAMSIRKNASIERIVDAPFWRGSPMMPAAEGKFFDFEPLRRQTCAAVGRHSPCALQFLRLMRTCDQRTEEDAA